MIYFIFEMSHCESNITQVRLNISVYRMCKYVRLYIDIQNFRIALSAIDAKSMLLVLVNQV